MSSMNDSELFDDPVFQSLLVKCLESLERGDSLDVDELKQQYPQFAQELDHFLADRQQLEVIVSAFKTDVQESEISADEPTIVGVQATPQSSPMSIKYIGEFEVLNEIARGGMGVVYKARQESLKRLVALKVILSGRLADTSDVERFRREAQAAARLTHPNIVSVHEIGEHEGCQYFTMDFVEGQSLSDAIRDEPLSPRKAAKIVSSCAKAVHYAHQQGTVHRDLKPGNVLLDYNETPMVTDFGLAKAFEGEDVAADPLTETGQVLGTPGYMPPEQAEGKVNLVGPTSDVYSLGAILYACLTARPPFAADNPLDTILQVRRMEPVPPRRLNPTTPKDLENICLMCLNKEPHRRYGSAELLADDLDRFLERKPVTARPVSRVTKSMRWARRNPVVASLSTLLVLLLLTLAIGGPIVAAKQAQLAENEIRQRKQTEWQLHLNKVLRVAVNTEVDRYGDAKAVLESIPVSDRNWELRYLERKLQGTQRTLYGHQQVRNARFLNDGKTIASIGGSKLVVWSLENGQRLRTIYLPGEVTSMSVCPNKNLIACGIFGSGPGVQAVQIVDPITGAVYKALGKVNGSVRSVDFSLDGDAVLTDGFGDQPFGLWQVSTEKSLVEPGGGKENAIYAQARYSSDNSIVATVSGFKSNCIHLRDPQSGKIAQKLTGHTDRITSLSFSPDHRYLATSGVDSQIIIWDLATGMESNRIELNSNPILNVTFSPDAQFLAGCCDDGAVYVWKTNGNQLFTEFRGHSGVALSLDFSPDGRQLVTASRDGTIKVWGIPYDRSWNADLNEIDKLYRIPSINPNLAMNVSGDRGIQIFSLRQILNGLTGLPFQAGRFELERGAVERRVQTAEFNKTGELIAIASGGLAASKDPGRVTLRKTEDGEIVASIIKKRPYARTNQVRFDPTGKQIAICNDDNSVSIRSSRDLSLTQFIDEIPFGASAVAFSPNGDFLATSGGDTGVILWQVSDGKQIDILEGRHGRTARKIAYDSTGRFLAATSFQGVSIWDVHKKLLIKSHDRLPTFDVDIAFSPREPRLAVLAGNSDSKTEINLYDVQTGEVVFSIPQVETESKFVSFSFDGSTIYADSKSGKVQRWDSDTYLETQQIQANAPNTTHRAITPDGAKIATAFYHESSSISVQDSFTFESIRQLKGCSRPITKLLIAGDNVTIAGSTDDGRLMLWDINNGKQLLSIRAYKNSVDCMAFDSNGRLVATAGGQTLKPGTRYFKGQYGFQQEKDVDGNSIEESIDNSIKVWDVNTGRLLSEFSGHKGRIRAVGFSHDSSEIVAARWNGSTLIGDIKTNAIRYVTTGRIPLEDPGFVASKNMAVQAIGSVLVYHRGVNPFDISIKKLNSSMEAYHRQQLIDAEMNQDLFRVKFHIDRLNRCCPNNKEYGEKLESFNRTENSVETQFATLVNSEGVAAMRLIEFEERDWIDCGTSLDANNQLFLRFTPSIPINGEKLTIEAKFIHRGWPRFQSSDIRGQSRYRGRIWAKFLNKVGGDTHFRLPRIDAGIRTVRVSQKELSTNWAQLKPVTGTIENGRTKRIQRIEDTGVSYFKEIVNVPEDGPLVLSVGVGTFSNPTHFTYFVPWSENAPSPKLPVTKPLISDYDLVYLNAKNQAVQKCFDDTQYRKTLDARNDWKSIAWHETRGKFVLLKQGKLMECDLNEKSEIKTIAEFEVAPKSVELSPDGKRVVYETKTNRHVKLKVRDLASGKEYDLGRNLDPTWSPDGSTVLFLGYIGDNAMSIGQWKDGESKFVNAPTYPGGYIYPAYSPDGKQILFGMKGRDGTRQIGSMDLDGKNVKQLTENGLDNMMPSLSPDGKLLAYYSYNAQKKQREVRVLDMESRVENFIDGYSIDSASSSRSKPTWRLRSAD